MKHIVVKIALLLCLTIIFSACGNGAPVSNTPGSNTSVSNVPGSNTSISNVPTSSAPSAGPLESAGSSANIPATHRIVFQDSIKDPQAEYLNDSGGNEPAGTARLDLTLYEKTPGVYEGCGIITRTLIIPDNASGIRQEYVYRTGMIRAEDGREDRLTLICGMTEDKDSDTFLGKDAPVHMVSHKEATLLQKDIPCLVKLDGEKASISIKLHDQATLVFTGQPMEGPDEAPENETPQRQGIIYINSMGGSGDCAAILSAEYSAEQNSFSGKLFINGNGAAFESIDENVKFTLKQYDSSLYQSSGGILRDKFTHMGTLHTGAGDFILLLDGKQVILERVGKGMFFCGGLFSDSQRDNLYNEADKTRKMLTYLFCQKSGDDIDYSQFEGLNPDDPEDMEKILSMSEELDDVIGAENGVPAWYPVGLIPTVDFSEPDGYLTTPVIGQQIFKLYNTQYYENMDFEDLVSPYRKVLSSYDNYKEYLDHDSAEGVFLFTMGRYSLQVYLQQSSLKLTSVNVYIY
ncbi:MAG TPA: hypothetical protein VHT96_05130 [Clostridia bacterium]|nr:hypothetical protein [Clostridia bacterium]